MQQATTKTVRLVIDILIPENSSPTQWLYDKVKLEEGEDIVVLEDLGDPMDS